MLSMSFNPLQIVVFGYASAFADFVGELSRRGHHVLLLERGLTDLDAQYGKTIRDADLVIVSSDLTDGSAVGRWVTKTAAGVTAFHDSDTPSTLGLLEQDRSDSLTLDLVPAYHLYLSSAGGPLLQRLERDYGAQRALLFPPAVDPKKFCPKPIAPRWDMGYLGSYRRERQPSLNRLLLEPARLWPEGKFVIAGPPYPAGIAWPENVVRNEHLPSARQCEFYNASRFLLNLSDGDTNRAAYSPSARLLEIAACGTPIISEYWDGLETFFTLGTEILVAYSPETVLHHLTETSRIEAAAIGAAARGRVLAGHTLAHRAAQLEEAVQSVPTSP